MFEILEHLLYMYVLLAPYSPGSLVTHVPYFCWRLTVNMAQTYNGVKFYIYTQFETTVNSEFF